MSEQSKQINWNTAKWGAIGSDIVRQMEGHEDDEDFLRSLAEKAVDLVRSRELEIDPDDPDKKPQQSALSRIGRSILATHPRKPSKEPNYWYDGKGQQNQNKWRHNIFKYLTLGRGIKTVPNQTQEIESSDTLEQPAKQLTKQPTEQPLPTLENMNIEQLELDFDTQQILESALDQSGMTLPDFIRQAIKVYAKTITGKTKKQGEDLSGVPTDKLKNDPAYNTHPGRAEELTKRAIKAIKYYNANVATEEADRWCITQSAIALLTGSRASTVGKVLEQFKDDISSHNQTYNLGNYSNRRRGRPKIQETIQLDSLVPDGLD